MTAANKVTLLRFVITLIFFVVLTIAIDAREPARVWLIDAANILFLLAGFLDVVDGYLARKYNETSALGRVMDPLVDKIIISGAFIFCIQLPGLEGVVQPWMVVVIIVREFVVQGIRVEMEASGKEFGAQTAGKIKTFVQSFTTSGLLLYAAHLSQPPFQPTTGALIYALVWLTVISTAVSGIIYLVDAVRFFTSEKARLP